MIHMINNSLDKVMVKKIQGWMRKYAPYVPYEIKEDNSVEVKNNLILMDKKLENLPFAFSLIDGNFDCANNKLTSFHNFPQEVRGYCNVHNNKITSLKDCPEIVGGSFRLTKNPIELNSEELPKDVNALMFIDNEVLLKVELSVMGSLSYDSIKLANLKSLLKTIEQKKHLENILSEQKKIIRKKI